VLPVLPLGRDNLSRPTCRRVSNAYIFSGKSDDEPIWQSSRSQL